MLPAPNRTEALGRKLSGFESQLGEASLQQVQKEKPPSMTLLLCVVTRLVSFTSAAEECPTSVWALQSAFQCQGHGENDLHSGSLLQEEGKGCCQASWDTPSTAPFWTGMAAPTCCTSCHGCPGHCSALAPACTSRAPPMPPALGCLRTSIQSMGSNNSNDDGHSSSGSLCQHCTHQSCEASSVNIFTENTEVQRG